MAHATRISVTFWCALIAASILITPAANAQDIMALPEASPDVSDAHDAFVARANAGPASGDDTTLIAIARDTLALAERQQPASLATLARARYNLGLMRLQAGDVGAVIDFRKALEQFEAAYGPDAEPLVQPLVMAAKSELLYAYDKGTFQAPHIASWRAHVLETRARRIALASYGRDTIPFLEYELRSARFPPEEPGALHSIHLRTGKLGPEGALLHADASDALSSMLIRSRRMLGVIEVLEGAIARLDAADLEAREVRRLFHGRLVLAHEMRDAREAATEHCLAFARYSSDTSSAQLLFLSEYQFRQYEGRFPLAVPVRVQVDAKGYVTRAELMADDALSGSTSAKAIEAAYRQRFAPRMVGGEPVVDDSVITRVRVDDAVLSRMFRVPCKSARERSALTRFLNWSCQRED